MGKFYTSNEKTIIASMILHMYIYILSIYLKLNEYTLNIEEYLKTQQFVAWKCIKKSFCCSFYFHKCFSRSYFEMPKSGQCCQCCQCTCLTIQFKNVAAYFRAAPIKIHNKERNETQ